MNVLKTASASNHQAAISMALSVLAQMHLFDDREMNRRRFQVFDHVALTLALRAWATDDVGLARHAREIANVPFRALLI